MAVRLNGDRCGAAGEVFTGAGALLIVIGSSAGANPGAVMMIFLEA